VVSCAKTADLMEMPFGMLSRVDPRNPWSLDVSVGKNNFEGKGKSAHDLQHCDVSCAKTSEQIEMLYGVWTQLHRAYLVLASRKLQT